MEAVAGVPANRALAVAVAEVVMAAIHDYISQQVFASLVVGAVGRVLQVVELSSAYGFEVLVLHGFFCG